MKNRNILTHMTAFLLAVTLLLSLCPSVFAEVSEAEAETETQVAAETETEEIIHIETADDLLELSKNCTLDTWSQDKVVELEGNISLEGTDFSPIPSFSGTFHGNGYSIRGLSISGKQSTAGLFLKIGESGEIYDLHVSGSIQPGGDCEAVGGIAAVNEGTISDCTFSGSISGRLNTGGIVGTNAASGRIQDCSVSGSVEGDRQTGGIAGTNNGTISDCQNTAFVNVVNVDETIDFEKLPLDLTFDLTQIQSVNLTNFTMDTGGIAGYSTGIIEDCTNTSVIGYPHVSYNTGGIAGRSCGYIHSCENTGVIYGRKDVGGIVGQAEPYVELQLSESSLSTIEVQLAELNALIDQAAAHASGGANSVSARLGTMSGYVDSAVEDAKNIRLNVDATGNITGSAGADAGANVTVTPPELTIGGEHESIAGSGIAAIPGAIISGGGTDGSGSISADATPGEILANAGAAAGGAIDAAANAVVTPDYGGLTSSISGLQSQIDQLNSAVSGTTGQLASDVQQINQKYSELTDTLYNAMEDASTPQTVVTDASATDPDTITLGKIAQSSNSGEIQGDLNVGGIAGSLSMEYPSAPESETSSELSWDQKRQYALRAVLLGCQNDGTVSAKYSFVGSVCGRMDLGLIADCRGFGSAESENGSYVGGIAGLGNATIRSCFAKCSLSGKSYVGGIVGSGLERGAEDTSSTVTGCCSMVEITDCEQYSGAIAGRNAGEFLENYFVSDTLAGIDGQSYGGKAEPIGYDALLETENLPNEFRTLTLRFAADDTVLTQETFSYGDSFDESVYPELPQKDGYYAQWDRTELDDLRFDTVVSAVYTPYTTAVSAGVSRDNGQDVFLVEGDYDGAAQFSAQALAKSTEDFAPISRGLTSAISHYLKSASWYRLPSTPINRDVEEQWHLTLPQDGSQTHTVHYTSPENEIENVRIYTRQNGSWEQADCEIFGDYLTFEISGTEADVAAVTVLPVWWGWLALGLVLLAILILLILLVRKLIRKKRARTQAPAQETPAAETSDAPSAPAPAKKRRWIWLVIVLAVLALAAAYFIFCGRDSLKAYHALETLNNSEKLSMDVTVDAALDSDTTHTETTLQRKTVDGHLISYVQIEGVPLYYTDGAVILENGKAYQIHESFPDYAALLQKIVPLYLELKAEHEDDTWTVTIDGETAQALLQTSVPGLSEDSLKTQTVTIRVQTDGDDVEKIELSANGTMQNDLPFAVTVCMEQFSHSASFEVPDAVLATVNSPDGDLPVITEDVLSLLAAWQRWKNQSSQTAVMSLSANLGPLVVDQSFNFYAGQFDGKQIYAISKDGVSIYWSNDQVVRQDGTPASAEEKKLAKTSELLDVLYW